MAYKISGNTSENSRILVVKQSDWSMESIISGTIGAFEISGLTSGKKVVIAINNLGKISSLGNITPIEF